MKERFTIGEVHDYMNPNEDKSYGVALSEKQLKFLVQCIDIAQKTESISPDKEEMDLIRRIGRKADELLDNQYDEYSEYDLKG